MSDRAVQKIDRAIAATIAMAIVVLWEIASRKGWVEPVVFPAPSRIVMQFISQWRGEYAGNVAATLSRFFGGLLFGGVPGLLLGLSIGWFPRLRRIVDPFIAAIHPVPKLLIFPILIVIFGMSEMSKIAAVSLTVFFPMLINSATGVRQISPRHFEVIQSYGGGRFALFRHVVLRGSLPMILSGVRISANLGLLVTTAIEFTVATKGIGAIIWLSWQTMRIEDLYVGVVTLSLLGITMNMFFQWLLRRAAPWQVEA